MSPDRWSYLKQLAITPRFIYISCEAGMKPADPLWPNGPKVPWVQRPGTTYRKPTTETKEELAL